MRTQLGKGWQKKNRSFRANLSGRTFKIVISVLGLFLLFNLAIAPSIVAEETGQNANVSSDIKPTLPMAVLEKRTKFDEKWERLKNDPDFMKILERERERRLLHFEIK